jgi:hypothetical protein
LNWRVNMKFAQNVSDADLLKHKPRPMTQSPVLVFATMRGADTI